MTQPLRPTKGAWQAIQPPEDQMDLLAYQAPFGLIVFSSISDHEWRLVIREHSQAPTEFMVNWVKNCFDAHDFREDKLATMNVLSKRIV